MKWLCLLLVVCIFPVFSVTLNAEIPKLINYQGMLTDESGNPLTGSYDLIFYIYDDTTGGDLKWSETQTGVQVQDGLFNVVLGKQTILNINFDESYWLAVKIGTETMPRIRITSVGYAYRAMVADSARVTTPGAGSHWSVSNSVLYTNEKWGIARGGADNALYGYDVNTHVNLGAACTTGASGWSYAYCTIGGGDGNTSDGNFAVVAGGRDNRAGNYSATVGGGYSNNSIGDYATIGGGIDNRASGSAATVGGGGDNIASEAQATVGGGSENTASGAYASVAGGRNNTSSGFYAAVGGGRNNNASGERATVPGGSYNTASGNHSFTTGYRAKANHLGTFVWADSSVNADFASTNKNQFLIRAAGGVGIGVTNPEEMLEIENAMANKRVFLKIQASHPTEFEEVGIRLETPQNRWHLRMDDHSNDNLPDVGSLALRSQNSGIEVMTWTNDGKVGIATTTPQQRLDVNGIVRIRNWGSGTTYDVRANTNGDLTRITSSKRYKKNIRGLESNLDKILDLKPVSFEWKTTGEKDIGLIAEDVHELIPELVGYDKEGRPDAVRYELLSLYVLEVMKEQVQAIEQLKSENQKLKQRIEVLERK
jgi:hypothetical protein